MIRVTSDPGRGKQAGPGATVQGETLEERRLDRQILLS